MGGETSYQRVNSLSPIVDLGEAMIEVIGKGKLRA